MKYLDKVKIINYSGFTPKYGRSVDTLRKNYYFIQDEYSITGDAPKDFMNTEKQGRQID